MSEQKLSESVKQRVAKLREFVSYAGKAEPVERLALDLANKLEAMERVIEAAKQFAAAGYAEPNLLWRKPLLDALAAQQKGR